MVKSAKTLLATTRKECQSSASEKSVIDRSKELDREVAVIDIVKMKDDCDSLLKRLEPCSKKGAKLGDLDCCGKLEDIQKQMEVARAFTCASPKVYMLSALVWVISDSQCLM